MEWLPTTLAMILGVLLRVAVPIVVTFLVVFFLKKLDERWKKDLTLELATAGSRQCWMLGDQQLFGRKSRDAKPSRTRIPPAGRYSGKMADYRNAALAVMCSGMPRFPSRLNL